MRIQRKKGIITANILIVGIIIIINRFIMIIKIVKKTWIRFILFGSFIALLLLESNVTTGDISQISL